MLEIDWSQPDRLLSSLKQNVIWYSYRELSTLVLERMPRRRRQSPNALSLALAYHDHLGQ
jgi:hypothetical protein